LRISLTLDKSTLIYYLDILVANDDAENDALIAILAAILAY